MVRYHECGILDTCITLTITDKDTDKARRALATAVSDIRRLQRMVHPTKSAGMQRTNVLLKSGEWFTVNPSLFNLIKESKNLYRLSGGNYNPASRSVVQPVARDEATMDDIEIEGIRIRSRNPRVHLDFGHALHGQVADTVIRYLKSVEIESAQLQIGVISAGLSKDADWPLKLPVAEQSTVRVKSGDSACLAVDTDPPSLPYKATLVTHESGLAAAASCMALLASGDVADIVIAQAMGANMILVIDRDGAYHRLKKTKPGPENGIRSALPAQSAIEGR